jgi:amino acid adenylation domain-containing protein
MSKATIRIQTFDQGLKQEQDYWLSRMAESVSCNIRADYERPAAYAAHKGRLDLSLPEALSERMTKLASGSPFLVYTILMAVLKICLHRYTGNAVITVGSPARKKNGEPNPPSNALPIVDAVDGSTRFKEFLTQVRQTLAEAYKRQNYPFDHLIVNLGLDHIENRCALFDIALALENIHAPLPDAKNDMTLTFAISEGAISGRIEFNSSLFAAETIERFSNHLLTTLGSAIENIDSPIAELEMLTEQERHHLLTIWNQTASDFSSDKRIHDLFESQVMTRPEATALIFEGGSLTYRALNDFANRIAHCLRSLGVGPESMVGLCAERSPEAIAGLMAILKAGGVYLPIDPRYPRERVDFMLRDAGVSVLLTQQALLEQLLEYEGKIVCFDRDREMIASHSADNLDSLTTPDNAAYVIYTSGSTGQPKGVVIRHRGLCNLIESHIRDFDMRPESRVLQFASLSFDSSMPDIFGSLVSGAALWLSNPDALFSGKDFSRLLRYHAITIATMPPAVLAVVRDDDLPALQTVISAGEQCSANVLRRWSSKRRFFNAYGPTEATVCTILFKYDRVNREVVPIGRPIDNTQIYLLDSLFRPVPVGVAGELFIGGVALARCYLNRPDLTAEKFIPDPFSSEPGARLYTTGDLARYLPDGNVEFIGRSDSQVKIRGYRIETGEIEAALKQHPSVQENIVVVGEDAAGGKLLVAYAVARPGLPANPDELRDYLKRKLPEYMMPSVFVMLEAFPLTTHGKIDRRALPSPNRGRRAAFVPPGTPTEAKLAEIWSELLGIDEVDADKNLLVGINDSFFDLGGHSLLAVRMFARVREAFGVELPMNIIFTTAPTIAGLARAIEERLIEQADAGELASMLKDLDGLSDEEIQSLIESEIESQQ